MRLSWWSSFWKGLGAPRLAVALGLAALGLVASVPHAAADEPDDESVSSAPAVEAAAPNAPSSLPAGPSTGPSAGDSANVFPDSAAQPAVAAAAAAPAGPAPSWCVGDLESLPNEVCAFIPPKEGKGPRTLLIFLHGVIQPGATWQWAQQRGAARIAARYGFTMIAPRGRRGTGPKGMEDYWTWPTAAAAQRQFEAPLIDEWLAARDALEKRAGKPFERVFVFGFSNGAYYATSLAMRDRLPMASGYAVFAGGSGAPYLRNAGVKTKRRAPVYVGWGNRDGDHEKQEKLAKMLREMRWPSKARGAKGVGHTMTDAQVDEAIAFLSRRRDERSPQPKRSGR